MKSSVDIIIDNLEVTIDGVRDDGTCEPTLTIVVATDFAKRSDTTVRYGVDVQQVADVVLNSLFPSPEHLESLGVSHVIISVENSHLHPSITDESFIIPVSELGHFVQVSGYNPILQASVTQKLDAIINEVPEDHINSVIYGTMLVCMPLSGIYASAVVSTILRDFSKGIYECLHVKAEPCVLE